MHLSNIVDIRFFFNLEKMKLSLFVRFEYDSYFEFCRNMTACDMTVFSAILKHDYDYLQDDRYLE